MWRKQGANKILHLIYFEDLLFLFYHNVFSPAAQLVRGFTARQTFWTGRGHMRLLFSPTLAYVSPFLRRNGIQRSHFFSFFVVLVDSHVFFYNSRGPSMITARGVPCTDGTGMFPTMEAVESHAHTDGRTKHSHGTRNTANECRQKHLPKENSCARNQHSRNWHVILVLGRNTANECRQKHLPKKNSCARNQHSRNWHVILVLGRAQSIMGSRASCVVLSL